MPDPDYGVYHHSSREDSEKLRSLARVMFVEAFRKIGMDEDANIRIVDIGCGLGFLTVLCATYFKNARITAIDTFSDQSITDNSKERLMDNLKIAGVYDRVAIVEADITKSIRVDDKFDLAVSNLVLHNTGRHRFDVYRNVRDILRCGSYFIDADGFIRKGISSILVDPFRRDMSKISNIFEPEFAMEPRDQKKNAAWRYILVGLRSKCSDV
ncbi:trans-aconitate 2-methyltransferase [Thermoplasma sp.]|uniref:class I SAM-dependent methyltransferase n=1 Tax=Thermoplasma sp. TaxID=1973142 RepID=UPI002638EEAB|nr:class I SAM-dependent methyltransferase [Thermoplasma sp.]